MDHSWYEPYLVKSWIVFRHEGHFDLFKSSSILETHGAKIGADPWHVCLDDEHRHLKRYTTIVCQTSLSELNGCETPKTVRERGAS
jgi:hypothetical protein